MNIDLKSIKFLKTMECYRNLCACCDCCEVSAILNTMLSYPGVANSAECAYRGHQGKGSSPYGAGPLGRAKGFMSINILYISLLNRQSNRI